MREREREEKKKLDETTRKSESTAMVCTGRKIESSRFSIRSTEVSQFKFSVDLKVETATRERSERTNKKKTMN